MVRFKIASNVAPLDFKILRERSPKNMSEVVTWLDEQDPSALKSIRRVYLSVLRHARQQHWPLDDFSLLNTFFQKKVFDYNALPENKDRALFIDQRLPNEFKTLLTKSYISDISLSQVMLRRRYQIVRRWTLEGALSLKESSTDGSLGAAFAKMVAKTQQKRSIQFFEWLRHSNEPWEHYAKNYPVEKTDRMIELIFARIEHKTISPTTIEALLAQPLLKNHFPGVSMTGAEFYVRFKSEYPQSNWKKFWVDILKADPTEHRERAWGACDIKDDVIREVQKLSVEDQMSVLNHSFMATSFSEEKRYDVAKHLCENIQDTMHWRVILENWIPEKKMLLDLIDDLQWEHVLLLTSKLPAIQEDSITLDLNVCAP